MFNSAQVRPRLLASATLFSALLGAGLLAAQPAQAGVIPLDTYLQFSFDQAGGAVVGCDPADPGGNFCIASSGTLTTFLDAPAWTFDGSAILTVVDAFSSGDRFDIFDFGNFIGRTSLPARAGVDCGDDPLVCLANPGMSTGVFALGAGAHSLTMVATQSQGLGSGYLLVTAAAVPEPASAALVLGALGIMWGSRRRVASAQLQSAGSLA